MDFTIDNILNTGVGADADSHTSNPEDTAAAYLTIQL